MIVRLLQCQHCFCKDKHVLTSEENASGVFAAFGKLSKTWQDSARYPSQDCNVLGRVLDDSESTGQS